MRTTYLIVLLAISVNCSSCKHKGGVASAGSSGVTITPMDCSYTEYSSDHGYVRICALSRGFKIGVYPVTPSYNDLGQLTGQTPLSESQFTGGQACYKPTPVVFGLCDTKKSWSGAVTEISNLKSSRNYRLEVSYVDSSGNAVLLKDFKEKTKS